MNYIKNLELEAKAASAFEQAVAAAIVDFKSTLRLPKYQGVDEDGERKDWISVGDVWRWLERIEESAYHAKFSEIEVGRIELREAAEKKKTREAFIESVRQEVPSIG